MLNSLVESNAALRKEIDTLDEQLAQYRYGDEEGNIPSLVNDLNRIKIVNGLIEVSGPGVELTLGGPLAPEELQDIINELRNAGAEAIVLNERRIIVSSVVALDPSGLVLDGAPLLPPYRFAAIGSVVTSGGWRVAWFSSIGQPPGYQMELQKRQDCRSNLRRRSSSSMPSRHQGERS